MNIKTIIIAITLIASAAFTGSAQDAVKIGYTNIELILAYTPEALDAEKQIQTIEKKVGEQMQIKEQYAQQKLQEYMQMEEAGTLSEEDKKTREAELMKLDGELQKFAQGAEQEVFAQRQKLLEPVLEKIQNAIDETAEEDGYSYILNQTTSAGVSTILFGPETNDVTEKIMKKLGIQLPEDGTGAGVGTEEPKEGE